MIIILTIDALLFKDVRNKGKAIKLPQSIQQSTLVRQFTSYTGRLYLHVLEQNFPSLSGTTKSVYLAWWQHIEVIRRDLQDPGTQDNVELSASDV